MKFSWTKVNWLDVYPVVLVGGIIIAGIVDTFAPFTVFLFLITVTLACATMCHKLEIKKYETERLKRLLENSNFNEDDLVVKTHAKSYEHLISSIKFRMIILSLVTIFFSLGFITFLMYFD